MSDPITHQKWSVLSWVRKGSWSVLDQGLFAGANFVINVLLARWLEPAGFGAFTVAFAIFLLLGSLHGGLIVEPMLVFGAGKFESRLRPYLRVLLKWHALFCIFTGVVLGLLGLFFHSVGSSMLGSTLLTLAWTQAFVLFLWMMRQACYVRLQPQWAASAGSVYAIILVFGAVWLNSVELLSVTTGLELMAVGSLVAGAWIAFRMRIPLKNPKAKELSNEARVSHWSYGKWASATGGLQWLHGYLPFLILPIWAGLEESGALRALFNLIMPALHAFTALLVLLVPIFVRALKNGRLKPTFYRALVGVGVLGVGYGLVIGFAGPAIMESLYAGKYNSFAGAIWLAALLPPIVAVVNVAMALLRAVERPKDVFVARAGAAGIAVTVGVLCVRFLGFTGALVSDILSNLTEGVLMLRVLRKKGLQGLVASDDTNEVQPQKVGPGRLKILVSAYACQPGRGSEPGQGWAIARGLAEHHDVWLLTYPGYGFHDAIETELTQNPVDNFHVVYHRLGFEGARHLHGGQDRKGLLEQFHYLRWQQTAARKAQRLHEEIGFDLTQHASHMKYWAPSALAAVDAPFVWGPVGGGESTPNVFVKNFSFKGRLYERLRDSARKLFSLHPGVHKTAQAASLALATTPETATAMQAVGATNIEVVNAVALPDVEVDKLMCFDLPDEEQPLQLLSAGRLLHWKGYEYGIRAFSRALEEANRIGLKSLTRSTYWILGDGPDRVTLELLVKELDIEKHVQFAGMVPRQEVLERLRNCHVFVHPSFHDCGGYATLEAMASGRPVICLNLGGPGIQVTPECGFRIEATSPSQVISDMADSILQFANTRLQVRTMGSVARKRVDTTFRWNTIIEGFVERHFQVLGHSRPVSNAVSRLPEPSSRLAHKHFSTGVA